MDTTTRIPYSHRLTGPEQGPAPCTICGEPITDDNWYLVDESSDKNLQHMVCP